jgi:hypothetical protein
MPLCSRCLCLLLFVFLHLLILLFAVLVQLTTVLLSHLLTLFLFDGDCIHWHTCSSILLLTALAYVLHSYCKDYVITKYF